jgi:hypothetical protein
MHVGGRLGTQIEVPQTTSLPVFFILVEFAVVVLVFAFSGECNRFGLPLTLEYLCQFGENCFEVYPLVTELRVKAWTWTRGVRKNDPGSGRAVLLTSSLNSIDSAWCLRGISGT